MTEQNNPGWLCFNEWCRPKAYHLIEFELKDRRQDEVQVRKGIYCGMALDQFKSGTDQWLSSEIRLWRYQPPKENTCVESTS